MRSTPVRWNRSLRPSTAIDLHFSCGYTWRFNPIARLINQDMGLRSARQALLDRIPVPDIQRRQARSRKPGTSAAQNAGGGILNFLGCHWFDLMRYLTGAEVARVAAIEANVGGHDIDVEDAAAVSLAFDNGMIGSLHAGYFTSGDGEISIGLRGSDGWIKWEVDEGRCTIKSEHPDWSGAPVRRFDFPSAQVPGYGPEGRASIQAFAAAIRGEGSSGYKVEEIITSLKIIEAAHESAAQGRTVTL